VTGVACVALIGAACGAEHDDGLVVGHMGGAEHPRGGGLAQLQRCDPGPGQVFGHGDGRVARAIALVGVEAAASAFRATKLRR